MIKKFEEEYGEVCPVTKRKKKTVSYKNNDGELHREDGPAIIWYYEDGNILTEGYLVNDKRHRIDGPAYVGYNVYGVRKYEVWCYNDVIYSFEVEKWLIRNNIHNWKDMKEDDFNRMWFEIL